MEYWLYVAGIIFLASLSSLFSSALKNSNLDQIENQQEENKKANRIIKLKLKLEDYNDLYSPVEMLLYIVASVIFSALLFSENKSLITLFYLIFYIFGITIILKSIFSSVGRIFNHKILIPLATTAYFLYYINKPFILIIRFFKKLISNKSQADDSRDELTALVESAHEEGSIDPEEYRILKNIMNFSDVLVSDVMTPRTVVFSLPADKTIEEIIDLPEMQMYSRIPVWQGESIDDTVVGYVMTKDILLAALKGNSRTKLRDMSREIYFIPENAELDIALDRFLKRRQHVLLVVDEYGGVEGMITMEDVMETILGSEIVDEADKVVDLREYAKHRRDKRVASVHPQS